MKSLPHNYTYTCVLINTIATIIIVLLPGGVGGYVHVCSLPYPGGVGGCVLLPGGVGGYVHVCSLPYPGGVGGCVPVHCSVGGGSRSRSGCGLLSSCHCP